MEIPDECELLEFEVIYFTFIGMNPLLVSAHLTITPFVPFFLISSLFHSFCCASYLPATHLEVTLQDRSQHTGALAQ